MNFPAKLVEIKVRSGGEVEGKSWGLFAGKDG